jgi:hypothetical protein
VLRPAQLALVLGLAVRAASAHEVPIPDSDCTFDPLTVGFPALGLDATAVAPGPVDKLRIVYRTGRQAAQFNAGSVPPRALSGIGTSATLAFPSLFEARMLASGDLTAAAVPLVLTVDGTPATLAVTLTTGLAAAAGVVVAGAPIAADGRFTLVGVTTADGLAAPLGGATAVLQLSCTATPVPDLDQFPLIETSKLAGTITTHGLHLRATVRAGSLPADFPATPALVEVSADGATMATVDLPDGLAAHGRHAFVGRSPDGLTTLTVRVVRRKPDPVYAFSVHIKGALAALPAGKRPTVSLTAEAGGLLARTARPFRGNRAGTHLQAP